MSALSYKYTPKEVDEILKTLTITVDTREQKNQHVRDYFVKKDIPFVNRTMKTGDYGCFIPANPDYGIMRDLFVSGSVERKNGVDELVESIKDRTRFENELIRASRMPFTLLVEDVNGYQKILNGTYRSQYKPQSLLGSLKTFEARYGFTTHFINPAYSGNYIYHTLLYLAREVLKS
ncbi:ERCC4 domain-containing protein [Shouchella clausii]|uniref:ERCC4 domain-containing protein n=1 Tax=Shouchella clausii TaxID=79880 RepID=UPI0026F438D8|nr:ERCC4 domain-containing protein [Shouchella clausii]MDO7281767.1 ERCC4 domain-containing protein [Shouchella clausii]MDO7301862.1 ERCC4 domain-containing protein [Shouchella clausii]